MAAVQFVGPASRDEAGRPFGTSRIVNVYPVPGERSPMVLRPVPGMAPFASPAGVFCRALETLGDDLHALHGGNLVRVNASGAVTSLMPVLDDEASALAGLEGHVLTVAGGAYKVWTTSDAAASPALTFDAASSVIVITRRALVTERDGRRFQWSAVGDPTTLDPLSYATAEQTDEPIIRAFALGGEAWLFKQSSIERWYPTGANDDAAAFGYVPGSLLEPGIKGFRLLCKIPGGAFFIGSDDHAYMAGAGGALQPVTSYPVHTSLKGAEPVACFLTRYEGETAVCIAFADRPAWCYGLTSGQWHERAQGADLDRWQAVAGAQAYGRQIVGTDTGLFTLDATGTDDGEPLHRVITSRPFENDGLPFRIKKFQPRAHVGRGSVTADRSRPPMVRLRLSEDYGETWAEKVPRSLGEEGQYDTKIIWRSMGQIEEAVVFELRCAEPLDIGFDASAFVEIA